MAKKKVNKNIRKPHCTFLGQTIAQSFTSLFVWEKLLYERDFSRIVELGTWEGNLSLFLYLHCLNGGADFYTFDIQDFKPSIVKDRLNFSSHFERLDIWENIEKIKDIIQRDGRTILFCDDGSKEEEFKTFAPLIKCGDIIGVHDWKSEIWPQRIIDDVSKNGLEKIMEEECVKDAPLIRFFIKK